MNLCCFFFNYEILKLFVCVCVKGFLLFKNNGKIYFILSIVFGNIRKVVVERYVIYSNVVLLVGFVSSLNNDYKVFVCININCCFFLVVILW